MESPAETYEIIVTNKKEALKVTLPENVVYRIKELSKFADKDFENISNEVILDIVLKSLDGLLYGYAYSQKTKEPVKNKAGASMKKESNE